MNGPTRNFCIGSFGRSGTVWFSKLLNAHPEVLCLHEGAILRQHPEPWRQAGAVETLRWVAGLADMCRWNVGLTCYQAVGDVNSIGGFHRTTSFANEFYRSTTHARLAEALGPVPLFLLLREPIASIESKLRMLEGDRVEYAAYARRYIAQAVRGAGAPMERWPAADAPDEAVLRLMLMLHWRWVAQLEAQQVFRLEDIGDNPAEAAAAAAAVTGIETGWEAVASGMRQRENASPHRAGPASEIYAHWSEPERVAYDLLCAGEAQRLGYPHPGELPKPVYLPPLDRPRARENDGRWTTTTLAVPTPEQVPVAIWGTGEGALKVLEALAGFAALAPAWCVDNDPARQGRRWMGLEVVAPAALTSRPAGLLIVGTVHHEAVRSQLATLGRIGPRVYFPDVRQPVATIRRMIGGALGTPSFTEGADGI